MPGAQFFFQPEDRPAVVKAAVTARKLSGLGATEDQVNSRAVVPQRTDRKGTKIEDLAGTGDYEAPGG